MTAAPRRRGLRSSTTTSRSVRWSRVFDDPSVIVAQAHNRREVDGDPTAHAAVLALRAAAATDGSWRLSHHMLVVTLEPCVMCAGALAAARIGAVVFGAADAKAGGCGSLYNVLADPRLNHECPVLPGLRADEAAGLLETFSSASQHDDPLASPTEGCESGRIGWSRKPLWRKSPWVQIPLPPPERGHVCDTTNTRPDLRSGRRRSWRRFSIGGCATGFTVAVYTHASGT